LRFVVEGSGAWTTVDGVRLNMAPGDLVLTPAYAWHDHQNNSDEPMTWFDGLDLPLACYLDAQFFEFSPTGALQAERCGGSQRPVQSDVYVAFGGKEETFLNGVRVDRKRGDMFALPPWAVPEHHATAGDALLFGITDAPGLSALGLERVLELDTNQEITGEFD